MISVWQIPNHSPLFETDHALVRPQSPLDLLADVCGLRLHSPRRSTGFRPSIPATLRPPIRDLTRYSQKRRSELFNCIFEFISCLRYMKTIWSWKLAWTVRYRAHITKIFRNQNHCKKYEKKYLKVIFFEVTHFFSNYHKFFFFKILKIYRITTLDPFLSRKSTKFQKSKNQQNFVIAYWNKLLMILTINVKTLPPSRTFPPPA